MSPGLPCPVNAARLDKLLSKLVHKMRQLWSISKVVHLVQNVWQVGTTEVVSTRWEKETTLSHRPILSKNGGNFGQPQKLSHLVQEVWQVRTTQVVSKRWERETTLSRRPILFKKWWKLWTTSKVVPSCPGSVASEESPGCLQNVGKGDNLVT